MARKTTLKLDNGVETYAKILNQLSVRAVKIEKRGLYEFARVIRAAVLNAINGLPTMTQTERALAVQQGHKIDPLPEQTAGLLKGLYVKKHKQEGLGVVTQIGFAGYNARKPQGYWRRDIHGRSYYVPPEQQTYGFPNGEPNVAVGDWVNRGTRAYRGHKFMQKALNQSRGAAAAAGAEAMAELMDEIIDNTGE